ncbi:hypothetical protein [Vibrio ulleungensis]|uniref:Outer membrane protein beta-barrel domain-containing protein n=1 Tax=Vibrio ulleungensis TaxID=2807619 RepID=A0ABS2HCF1_9VIBR|nr:hypothetical protein [Vibrio ulleungensis]MBM7035278.1 hypothetical protein [Vibrio ulleungensis]
MKKAKTTLGILASLLAFSTVASQHVSFSDSHGLYSAAEVGYGNEGFDFGLQVGLATSNNYGVIFGYVAKEDLDTHNYYGELVSLNGGLGYRLNYEYGRHLTDPHKLAPTVKSIS